MKLRLIFLLFLLGLFLISCSWNAQSTKSALSQDSRLMEVPYEVFDASYVVIDPLGDDPLAWPRLHLLLKPGSSMTTWASLYSFIQLRWYYTYWDSLDNFYKVESFFRISLHDPQLPIEELPRSHGHLFLEETASRAFIQENGDLEIFLYFIPEKMLEFYPAEQNSYSLEHVLLEGLDESSFIWRKVLVHNLELYPDSLYSCRPPLDFNYSDIWNRIQSYTIIGHGIPRCEFIFIDHV